jgi:hypothetical protein
MYICQEKKSDENLTKVVSSIISIKDFEILEKYTKVYYNQNLLQHPTTSHMLRCMLNNWAEEIRKIERQPVSKRKLNQPAVNKLSTIKAKRDETTWMQYSKDGY